MNNPPTSRPVLPLRYPDRKPTVELDLRDLPPEKLRLLRDGLQAKAVQIQSQRELRVARSSAGIEMLDSDWMLRSGAALAITNRQIAQVNHALGSERLRHLLIDLRDDACMLGCSADAAERIKFDAVEALMLLATMEEQ